MKLKSNVQVLNN